jgi:hypothetical protein
MEQSTTPNNTEAGLVVASKPKTDPRFIDLAKNGLKVKRVKKDLYLELFSNAQFVGSISVGSYKNVAEARAAECLAELIIATMMAAIPIDSMQEAFDNIRNGLQAANIGVPVGNEPRTFNQDIDPTYSFSYYDQQKDAIIAGEVNLFAEIHRA